MWLLVTVSGEHAASRDQQHSLLCLMANALKPASAAQHTLTMTGLSAAASATADFMTCPHAAHTTSTY